MGLPFVRSRPTAVNLQDACRALSRAAKEAAAGEQATSQSVVKSVIRAAEAYFEADIATCKVRLICMGSQGSHSNCFFCSNCGPEAAQQTHRFGSTRKIVNVPTGEAGCVATKRQSVYDTKEVRISKSITVGGRFVTWGAGHWKVWCKGAFTSCR